MNIGPTERVFATFTVAMTDADGQPVELAAVELALLTPRQSATTTTTWTAAPVVGGAVTALYAGPEADPDGALAVPAGGADLFYRVVDDPEVVVQHVERISVK